MWPKLFPTRSIPGLARKPTIGPQALFLSPDGLRSSLPAFLLSGFNGVRRQRVSRHSVPTAARQLVNPTSFMRSFDVCSPLGFSKAGVLHFGLGRKYYISPLVTISLKKALFCPTSLERAEQMSSLCCFSSLLRMKGPILAGSSYLCKFSLRMIHKIIGYQSWTRDLQHIYSNLYYLWRETEAHRGSEDFALSNHVLEQTKPLTHLTYSLVL